jgi:hypothetical protein
VIRLPPSESPAPDPKQGLHAAEHRRHLLVHNREKIEFAYENALRHELDDPVIVVLDLSDADAARLAELAGSSKEQVDRWRRECSQRDLIPTQILAAPRWAVLTVIGPLTPNSPQGVIKPNPPGAFRVVAVAAGGNAFADFPLPPRPMTPPS